MKRKILYSLQIFAAILIFSSCTEKIELELDDTYTRIVVEGAITDVAKAHTIKLTYSTSYFYGEVPPAVEGADVRISDGDNEFILTETAPGIYQTDPTVKGVVGKTYTLIITDVDVDGDGTTEVFEASETMNPVLTLDSITMMTVPNSNPVQYRIDGWGQEPATEGDAYQWAYFRNSVLESDTLYETVFTNDELVNGSYIPGLTIFWGVNGNPGDTFTVETRSISQDYLNYINNLMAETVWSQGSFGGPPSNVVGNISNGGLGYFNAHSVSYTSTILK